MKRPRGVMQRIALPYSYSKRDTDLNPFDPLQYLLVSRIRQSSVVNEQANQPMDVFSTVKSPFPAKNSSDRKQSEQNGNTRMNRPTQQQGSNLRESHHHLEPIASEFASALTIQGKQLPDNKLQHSKTPVGSKPSFRLRKIAPPGLAVAPQKRLVGPGPHPIPHLPTTSFTRFKAVGPHVPQKPAALAINNTTGDKRNASALKSPHLNTVHIDFEAAYPKRSRSDSPPLPGVRIEMVE